MFLAIAGNICEGEGIETEKDLHKRGAVVCGPKAFRYFKEHPDALPRCTEAVIDMGDNTVMRDSEFYIVLEVASDETSISL